MFSSRPAPEDVIVSVTVSRYSRAGALRGLVKMASDHLPLRAVPGLTFYKLLGTGRNDSLSLGVDLRRWARLCVWTSREAFDAFEQSDFRRGEASRVADSFTLLLSPLRSHGRWDGVEPFGRECERARRAGLGVAVLTRASIRPSRLRAFWAAVPSSQERLSDQEGLWFVLGMGEVPLVRQATLSVWEDEHSARRFAYGPGGHRGVIERTRREGWYSEELFARFAVLEVLGSAGGLAPGMPDEWRGALR